MRFWGWIGIVTVAAAATASIWTSWGTTEVTAAPASATADKPSDEAVERTRKTVRMLDDIYKSAVVLITEHYVHDEDDLSAGSAAAALFGMVEEKGWHSARLIDATGQPYDEANAPADEFEQEAIRRLKRGEAYYDEVTERDGKPVLRAVTTVPVVMKKCVMCHPHYAHAEEGAAIGGIAYIIPIE